MKKRHSRRRSVNLPYLNYKVLKTVPEIYNRHLNLVLGFFDAVRKRRTIEEGVATLEKTTQLYLSGELHDRNGTRISPGDTPVQVFIQGPATFLFENADDDVPFLIFELYQWKREARTRVSFYREEEGTILAVFPDERANNRGGLLCYSLVDGHTSCSSDYLVTLPKATSVEYLSTLKHLEDIGYLSLSVIPRTGSHK